MSQGTGRAEVSDRQILSIVEEAGKPFVTCSGVADELPIERQAVNYRLNNLVKDGLLEKEKVGGRAAVYWLSD